MSLLPRLGFLSSLPFLLLIISFPLSISASRLSLYKLQPISNFPEECTSIYKGEIRSCSADEISKTGKFTSSGAGICSSQCIDALESINKDLNRACVGIQASPRTLIGLFFSGKGVSYLCPNSIEGNGPAPSSTTEDSSQSTTSSRSGSSSTITSSSSESSDPPAPATTSFQPTTVGNDGIATVVSTDAQRSEAAKSNPEAFGGGGSPFEDAASSSASSPTRGKVRNGFQAVMTTVLFWGFVVGCWLVVLR